MKDKIQKWILKNEKKLTIVNDICKKFYYVFFDLVCIYLLFAGFKTGKLNEMFSIIGTLILKTSIFAISLYGFDLLLDKWEEAKEKDEDENNKEDYGHFYMNGKDEENEKRK